MALTAPRPEDWRIQQAIVMQQADAAVIRLLKRASRDINAQLREVRSRPAGMGRDVREAQLNLIRRNLSEQLGRTWRELGNLVEARRAEAVARSIDFQRQLDVFRLQAAGVPGGATIAENIARTEAAQSSQGIDRMIARTTGASYVPLSRRVYNSQVGINSRIDRMVNSALARGLSADEFARELEPFINPNTPGGIRYAALRLARTEINNAAHAQAVSSVQNHPWIKRMKWHRSKSHPRKDICDLLAEGGPHGDGTYPKEAVPAKPHPHCFCYVVAVDEPDDDDDTFLDDLVAGYLEENRTEQNPVSTPIAPAPAPDRPSPPVRPTPTGESRPAGSRPTSQAPPPRPGAASSSATSDADREKEVAEIIKGKSFSDAVGEVQRKYQLSQTQAILLVQKARRNQGQQTTTTRPTPAASAQSTRPLVAPTRPAGARATSGSPPRATGSAAVPSGGRRLSEADRARINQVRGANRLRIDQELDRQNALVPATMQRLNGVSMASHADRVAARSMSSLAWYQPGDRQIFLGSEIFTDRYENELWPRERNTGWCSRTGHNHTGAQSVLAHEFGHHVSAQIRRLPPAERRAFWASVAEALGVNPPAGMSPKDMENWAKANKNVIRNLISKYGATDEEEMLAEIWQEYSTSGAQSRPAILRIGQLMQELAERGARR